MQEYVPNVGGLRGPIFYSKSRRQRLAPGHKPHISSPPLSDVIWAANFISGERPLVEFHDFVKHFRKMALCIKTSRY